MSKEQDQTQTQNRIITMLNGKEVDFGAKNNTVTLIDLENKSVTFHFVTGQTLEVKIEELSEEVLEICKVYAVANKVKAGLASLATVKTEPVLDENGGVTDEVTTSYPLFETAEKIVKDLKNGKFTLRTSSGDADTELEEQVKIYAVTAALFADFPFGYFPDWKDQVVLEIPEKHLHVWNEDANSEVQAEIAKAWAALDRKQKAAVRKDPRFTIIQGEFAKQAYSL